MTFCFIEAIEHGNASTYGSLLRSMCSAIRNSTRSVGGGRVTSVYDMLNYSGARGGGMNGSRGIFSQVSFHFV